MSLRRILTTIAVICLCGHSTAQVVIADAAKLYCDETTPSVELTIDDSDNAFYPTTGWTSGSFSGGYQGTYRYSTQSSTTQAMAYWCFDVPQPGHYRLALHYPAGPNRSTAAQYRFQSADGLHEFSVDQTAGGDWSNMGTFNLTTGTCVLQLSNRLSTAVVETLIVDDGDPLFSKTGYWSNGTISECYLGDYLFAGCSAAQTATVRWALPVLVPGNYDVDVWYAPGANRSPEARYVLQHSQGTTTRTVAQTGGDPGWHSLTPFHFDTGRYGVTLDNTGPPDRVIIADALRLRFCSDQGALPPVIDHYADLVTTPAAWQSFPVRANVWSVSPVTSVTAWYLNSGGTTITLPLFDDAAHGDGAASDGIYGGELPGAEPCSVIRYGIEACNNEGGVGRTPELKCLVACEDTTCPELRVVFMNTPRTPSDMDARLASVRSGNFNAVIPSVRNIADAYYLSSFEPMAAGVLPGYDPLADLIAKAHETSSGQQRLQVHPLVLVYRVLTTEIPPPGHVLDLHPEWTSEDYAGQQYVSNRLYVDQGVPEVQDYLVSVFMEIVHNYDIDGFNLDLIRYADQQLGYNPIALSWFHAFTGRSDRPATDDAQWCEWRRQQVTALVRRMAALIRSEKPHVVLSADVVCWEDAVQAVEGNVFYHRVFQDWTGWMSKG